MGRLKVLTAAGFTLLELVVTLMVMALAVALVGPAIGRGTDGIRVRAEVARFAALLRYAREQAITSGSTHVLLVEPAAHRVRLIAGDEVRQTRALPADMTVVAEPPPGLSVRFEPEGTSTGGFFRLASGRIRYRVSVDRLTGRVRAERE